MAQLDAGDAYKCCMRCRPLTNAIHMEERDACRATAHPTGFRSIHPFTCVHLVPSGHLEAPLVLSLQTAEGGSIIAIARVGWREGRPLQAFIKETRFTSLTGSHEQVPRLGISTYESD